MASSETEELYVLQRAERSSVFASEESTTSRQAYLGALIQSRTSFDSNLQEVEWYDGPQGFHSYEKLVLLSTGDIPHDCDCSSCEARIRGFKWSCKDPSCNGDFHICTKCYIGDKHYKNHKFARIILPGDEEVLVGTRDSAEKLEVYGIQDDDDIREIIPELETGRVYFDHLPKLEMFRDSLNRFTPAPSEEEHPRRIEVVIKELKEAILKKKIEVTPQETKKIIQSIAIYRHRSIQKIKQFRNSAELKAILEELLADSDKNNATKGGQEISVEKICSLSGPRYNIKDAEISRAQAFKFNKF